MQKFKHRVVLTMITIIKVQLMYDCNGSVMVSILTLNVVDLSPDWVKSKTKIGICCFFAKYAALRRKSKDWLARNQDNVYEWGDMSIHELLFQRASTLNIQLSMYKADLVIISLKINLFSSRYSL